MNVAVVEDMTSDYLILEKMLQTCCRQACIDCCINHFRSGEEFLEKLNLSSFDAVFLDICLGDGINGMNTAKAVRTKYKELPIIFTTSETTFALEGFEVHALDYLVKPYTLSRFQPVIERLLMHRRFRQHITVLVDREEKHIYLDEIVCAEARDHGIHICLSNGNTLRAYMNLSELCGLLPKEQRFQVCCRGILINLQYVDRIDGTDFCLWNGKRLPISRANKDAMKKAFADYAIYCTREGGLQ